MRGGRHANDSLANNIGCRMKTLREMDKLHLRIKVPLRKWKAQNVPLCIGASQPCKYIARLVLGLLERMSLQARHTACNIINLLHLSYIYKIQKLKYLYPA
jgi:hypothetical protein